MALIMASETLAPLTPLWHWLVIIGSVAAFAGIGALLNLYQKRRARRAPAAPPAAPPQRSGGGIFFIE